MSSISATDNRRCPGHQFPISAHDGPVSHWDELCPKKYSVDIAHIFFGKPSLSNSAKGWVTILQKHFSQKYKFEFVGKNCAETINFQSNIWTTKYIHSILLPQTKLYFPFSKHWEVTVSVALSLICWGRDGTLLNITLESKWPPLPSSCFVFSFGFWLWTGDLGGKGGKSREAQIKCRLIWSRHRLKPFLASKLLSP